MKEETKSSLKYLSQALGCYLTEITLQQVEDELSVFFIYVSFILLLCLYEWDFTVDFGDRGWGRVLSAQIWIDRTGCSWMTSLGEISPSG